MQSAVGLEPLSLFRYASTTCEITASALNQRFAGVGDPAQTETFFAGDHPEFMVRDTRLGLALHTCRFRDQHDKAEVLVRERSRLSFLARALAEKGPTSSW